MDSSNEEIADSIDTEGGSLEEEKEKVNFEKFNAIYAVIQKLEAYRKPYDMDLSTDEKSPVSDTNAYYTASHSSSSVEACTIFYNDIHQWLLVHGIDDSDLDRVTTNPLKTEEEATEKAKRATGGRLSVLHTPAKSITDLSGDKVKHAGRVGLLSGAKQDTGVTGSMEISSKKFSARTSIFGSKPVSEGNSGVSGSVDMLSLPAKKDKRLSALGKNSVEASATSDVLSTGGLKKQSKFATFRKK